MTVASIIKTIVHIYCSSIFFNTVVPSPLSHQHVTETSNQFPTLITKNTQMTPTAPPEDRGSGR